MPAPNTQMITFRIEGMDCAEEVRVLKRALLPLVRDERRLGFDLLNGKLTLSAAPGGPSQDEVLSAVRATGMRAIPWEAHLDAQRRAVTTPTWQRYARLLLCATSGIFLAAGFALHAWFSGPAIALTGAGDAQVPVPAAVLYAVGIAAGLWYILPKALYAVRNLRPDMNLLMTVAVAGAIALGEWFEAGTVAFLFSLALVLEAWSVGRARRAISALMDLSPATARYRCPHDGQLEEKPVEQVPQDAVVLVRPGERVPLDGVVTEGRTTINQAPITGESEPAAKTLGDEVFAGTINNEGAFEFRVTKTAGDTTLAGIIRMIEEAQARRAPSEQWVERFALYYTPAMMVLALLLATLPPLLTDASWERWVYEGLVVLVIACPCALVISTPVSVVAGLASAARAGVLIKGGAFLEAPAHIRAVALDKTGTLTLGRPEVQRVIPLNGHDERELLARAAAVEASSEHHLAWAVLRKADEENVAYTPAQDFTAIPGMGAEASIDGRTFWIGSHRLLHERTNEEEAFHERAVQLEDAGHSLVCVGNDDHVCGLLAIADGIRPEAAAAIAAIKELGVEHVVMLTGDNEGNARGVASEVGVDEYRAELLPDRKVKFVEDLVAEYGKVAMVGDGINDAPAMAVSSLAIAMGAAGTDVARETADVALMSDDLTRIAWLIRHSRRAVRTIKQNIAFALGIKLLFLVMALAGAATLWMAIAADMGASLLVILNGMRLLRAPAPVSGA